MEDSNQNFNANGGRSPLFKVLLVVVAIALLVLAILLRRNMIDLVSLSFDISETANSLASQDGNTEDESSIPEMTRGLLNLSNQYKKADASHKTELLSQMQALALARKQALLSELNSPGQVIRNSLPSALRNQLPTEVRYIVEEQKELRGTLEWLISEDLEQGGVVEYINLIVDGTGERVALHFDGNRPYTLSGSKVKVRGVKLDNELALTSGDSGSFNVIQEAALPSSTRKIAIILVNFTNDNRQPYSQETARTVTFTASDSANAYYQEDSFDQLGLTGSARTDGDVYGWYTLPYDNSGCRYLDWGDAAKTLAAKDGFVASNYAGTVVAFPQTSSCAWWGMGSVGGNPSRAYVNGSYALKVVAHELGHNLGLYHSSSYSCNDGSASGPRVGISSYCTASEYGDYFDMMGNPTTYHFNIYQKGRALGGWLESANIQTVQLGTDGTFTIAPLEHSSSGVQALRIPRGSSQYIYVEYRQPSSFDNFSASSPAATGVILHLAPDYSVMGQPYLLDATPGTTSFSDAPLAVGQTFTDKEKGVSITTLSVSPTGAQVQVSFDGSTSPTCTNVSPTLSISSNQTAAAGQTLSYTYTLRNNDSNCPSSTYSITSTLPTGWNITPITFPDESLSAGASVTRSFSITSPSDAAPNTYSFSLTAINRANSQLKSVASANYTVAATDTVSPIVSILKPVNGYKVPSKGNFDISANATDNIAVASIQIALDGRIIKTCTASAKACTVKASAGGLSAGIHYIDAFAYDSAGNMGTMRTSVTK